MNFFKTHKIVSVCLIITLVVVGYIFLALIHNSSAEKSLKSQAPITALKARNSFDEKDIFETSEPFRCYDASRKFSSPDRYCTISYNVFVTPNKDVKVNYISYKKFFDVLLADDWDVGSLKSVNSWRDTFTSIPDGDSLKPDEDGVMNISGKKDLGNGAWCNLTSQYVPASPKGTYKNGILSYNIGCFYQVMKLPGS